MLQHRSTTTARYYGPTSPSSYEREPVHDADRARTRDPGSDTTVRAAPPNQSFQNLQVMERGGGPSYTSDQLPCPLAMSEGAGCTHGMVTCPSGYCTIRVYMAPDIPLPFQKGEKSVHFYPDQDSNPRPCL
jgi:hypothetical protein